jgi:drug/metabolite transporter (DMT)-like permease
LIGAGSQIFAKSVTDTIDPYSVLFVRGIIATVAYIIFLIAHRPASWKIDRADIKKLVILSLLNVPVNQLVFLIGLKMTTAQNSALAYSLAPVFVLIISYIFYREKPTPLKVIGIIIALVGVTIIFTEHGVDFRSEYFVGNLLVLAAAFAWSVYAAVGKEFSIKYGATYSNAITMIAGYMIYFPIYYFLPATLDISSVALIDWSKLLYLGLLTSCGSYMILYTVLKKMPSSKVAVFNNVQPILTAIFAVLILGSTLSTVFIIGGIIALGGVILTQRG